MKNYLQLSDNIITHEGFLEEMEACLDAASMHGVVFGQPIENKASQIRTAVKYLPEYTVTISINTDAVMIKGSVIELFGTPKEMTYLCLDEYCKKINKFGFSTVVAHHALYSQRHCKESNTHPIVPFLPLLDDDYYPKKRILFECTGLPDQHCGTLEVMLSSYESFCRLFGDKYDIYMLTNRGAAEFHKLEEKFGNILYPDTITTGGMFHLGFTPNPIMLYEQQLMLSRHCLKIVQQMFDIMTMRIRGHFDTDRRGYSDLGIRLSDGITFISGFSKTDFEAYFANETFAMEKTKLKVIHITKGTTQPVRDDYELPFDDYFFIVGSSLKHKAIEETIDVLSSDAENTEKKRNFIVVGTKKTGLLQENIYGYKSGYLDDDFMNFLYARCRAVIFPSMYEGFGLPVISALRNGKSLILNDNALNREHSERFSDFASHFIFYKRFDEIPNLLETAAELLCDAVIQSPISDTWDDVAVQMEEFFAEILDEKTDINRLKKRLWVYRHIEERTALSPFRDYKLSSMLRFAGKEYIKHKFPRMVTRLNEARG